VDAEPAAVLPGARPPPDRPPRAGVGRFLVLALRALRPYRLQALEVVGYVVLGVAFAIGMAKVQGLVLDRALLRSDRRALFTIMAVIAAALVVVSLAQLRNSYVTARIAESVLRDLRLRVFARLQRLHPGFFQRVQSGDILSRMTGDLEAVQAALVGALAEGLQIVLLLAAATVTIFLADWKLAVVALAGMPLFFVTGRWLGPAAARASLARYQDLAGATVALQENLGAQPVVKAFGLEDQATASYAVRLAALLRSSVRLTFVASIFGLSAHAIASAIELAVLGVGGWLVMEGNLTVGTLFTFIALLGQMIGPVQTISGVVQSLQEASGAMARVDEIMRAEPAIADRPGARDPGRLTGAIAFEGVSFSYDGERPALRDVTLTIPAGARVGIVGPSGCGKTTLLNLILRFYDPQAGRVRLDGVDLRDLALAAVRAQIGVVFQDSLLLDLSVRENIRLGNLAASDAAVEAAARAAEIHDTILALPQGYDTPVGEGGARLSGGQRQRLAIARAILRDPAILLLDEATSALDPRTEAAITATLERLGRGRTTVFVTHRLTSVRGADRIYVLDRGALVEEGTHAELLARDGLYARLWRQQQGAAALPAATPGAPRPQTEPGGAAGHARGWAPPRRRERPPLRGPRRPAHVPHHRPPTDTHTARPAALVEASLEAARREGLTIDEYLAAHPDETAELAPLLRLVAGMGRARPAPGSAPPPARRDARGRPAARGAFLPAGARRLVVGAAAAALVLMGAGMAGLGAAAQRAVPGDTLYPVKERLERVETALRREDALDRHARLSGRRLAELVTLLRRGDEDRAATAAARYERALAALRAAATSSEEAGTAERVAAAQFIELAALRDQSAATALLDDLLTRLAEPLARARPPAPAAAGEDASAPGRDPDRALAELLQTVAEAEARGALPRDEALRLRGLLAGAAQLGLGGEDAAVSAAVLRLFDALVACALTECAPPEVIGDLYDRVARDARRLGLPEPALAVEEPPDEPDAVMLPTVPPATPAVRPTVAATPSRPAATPSPRPPAAADARVAAVATPAPRREGGTPPATGPAGATASPVPARTPTPAPQARPTTAATPARTPAPVRTPTPAPTRPSTPTPVVRRAPSYPTPVARVRRPVVIIPRPVAGLPYSPGGYDGRR
jgi:ATP-binding cassette subfamily B protein